MVGERKEVSMENRESSRLVIVSSRLPFEIEKVDGSLQLRPGSGGLVTAMAPVLRDRGGLWVGWPGGAGEDEETLRTVIDEADSQVGFTFVPVFLDKEDVDLYYYGFSNEVIWPLFHDLQSHCRFDPVYWQSYERVNKQFADQCLHALRPGDFIWVHDYQLMLMGHFLREQGVNTKLGFFLHIPFPSPDIFMKLPWRFHVLRALLKYDLLGFQTARDHKNFINCVRFLKDDVQFQSCKSMHVCKTKEREVRIGTFPISIDFKDFATHAASKEISEAAWLLHENWSEQKIVFSLDRLDYTKGIPQRLEAIRIFLQNHPEFYKRVTFVQVVVPSRTQIDGYQSLKQEIDRLVGEINSQFAQENWVPVQYFFRSICRTDLLAFYRTSDVALVTSLKDGMNLVSKEYVSCQIEKKGVLVLSEFAGAAPQLSQGALLVHPYDVEGLAHAIFYALTLASEERVRRMEMMQRNVKRYDIFWWMRMFLKGAFARDLTDFPVIREYVPKDPKFQQEPSLLTASLPK